MKITNLLNRRNIVILSLFISTFTFGQGQGHYLPVSNISQQASQWCWAASMQMIINFHEPERTITQCSIAANYIKIASEGAISTDYCCDLYCGNFDESFNADCNRSIRTSSEESRASRSSTDFESTFIQFGYNSFEDIETRSMDWVKIKKEIESCRPFLIVLQKTKIREYDEYAHVVVAKGFYECGNQQYILANDPETLDICGNREILLPIDILYDSTAIYEDDSYTYGTANQIVRCIQPKLFSNCDCCRNIRPAKYNPLIQALEEMNIDQICSGDDYLLALEAHNPNIQSHSQELIRFDHTGKVIDTLQIVVLRSFNEEIEIRLGRNSKGGLKIRQIAQSTFNPFKLKIQVPDPTNPFCKWKELNASKKEFEVVEFLPRLSFFYRYQLNGEYYLTPVRGYKGFAEQGKAYLENEFLNGLQNTCKK